VSRPHLELVGGGKSEPRPARGPALELMALGTGLTLGAVLLGRLPSWRAELGTFQALMAAAFAFYFLAVWRGWHAAHSPLATPIVLVVALAARVAILPVTPTLSDDVYRSVWEGRAVAAGENPYRDAPAAPHLAKLRDEVVYPRLEHPETSTLAPPLALAEFALIARISPTVWAVKLWVLLHDLALCAALVAWGRRRGAGATAAIAYAWNPLVIAEFAGSGHHDPLSILWLVMALVLAEERPTLSALALAAAALTRFVPLLALPFLWRVWSRGARVVGAALLTLGLGFFVAATRGPDSGLTAIWRRGPSNPLLFEYLQRWMNDPLRARLLVLGIVGLVIVSLLWRRAPPEQATRATLRTGLIVSPAVHPWSLAWALALEPLGRSPGWLLLSLTCLLSYGLFAPPPEGGDFHLALAWRWLEYGAPLALVGTLAIARRRRAQRTTDRPRPRR
jgi:hypothetical protein